MGTLDDYYPSPWLAAADIGAAGAERNVRIVREVPEVLKDPKTGAEETKPTLQLMEFAKSLILNKTNFKTVAALHGPNSDTWGGKAITLFATQVDAFGETHDAIRVRNYVPSIPAEPQVEPPSGYGLGEEPVVAELPG